MFLHFVLNFEDYLCHSVTVVMFNHFDVAYVDLEMQRKCCV